MSDLFYLQDSRSNVGSRATFWRAGGGYTTNLDEAETFTRARAVRQYECRETDLPWPVDYVRARAEYGVDHQDLDLSRTQALATAPADDRIYVAYDRDWDGNCLVWIPEAAGRTSNLAAARTWPLDHAGILTARGRAHRPGHARPARPRRWSAAGGEREAERSPGPLTAHPRQSEAETRRRPGQGRGA